MIGKNAADFGGREKDVGWVLLIEKVPHGNSVSQIEFGVRTQQEEGSVVPGTPESAPARPRLLRIALINTALATAVFIAVYLVIQYKLVTADTIPFP